MGAADAALLFLWIFQFVLRREYGIMVSSCEETLLETKIPSAFYCSSCGLVVTVMKTYEEN